MKKFNDYILEGAWGYDPQDNDSVLDLRSDINVKIVETIYDECFKRVWGNDEGITVDGNSQWDAIGTIEYFFEKCCNLFEVGGDKEYEKYYYWWALKRDHQKDIVDLYAEAISRCAHDKQWVNSWKEPEKMKKSILKRTEKLRKYATLRDTYFQNDLNRDGERIDDVIDHIKHPEKPSKEKEAEIDIE